MKKIKKIAGLLLAMVMVLAMTTSVFAAPTNTTITAPTGSSRSYGVYQIFTGDLAEGVLSNVKWGKNGTGTEGEAVDSKILTELASVNTQDDTTKLETIEKYVNLTSTAFGTVSNGNPLTVPTGYYLIKDKGPVGDGEAYSLYVVEVVGPTTISPKTGTTTSEKKVKDTNDSTVNSTTDWQDSADYDIGDDVPFQLKATIADDYANYKSYKLTFHDKESTGLTFNNDIKVMIDNTVIAENLYTVVTEGLTDGDTFEVVFSNLKQTAAQAGSVITVEYTSKLNTQAVIGSAGNPNTMHITYSNNPNDEQSGGKTPDDKVIVFTYKVVVNKTDEKNVPLTGAGFTLYKKNTDGNYESVGSEVKGDNKTTFTWNGLDDGDYKLSETTTPAGYNTIADIAFTITAGHEVLSDNPALTSLSGSVISGTATFTPAVNDGSLSTNVVNQSGSTLPETGGIGTTIFYVIGTILVLGAAVLLVTKRRMNAQK